MRSMLSTERWGGVAILGGLLVIVGVGWLVMRELQVDPIGAIAEAGWPYYVIVPGVILLLLALLPSPPRGLGFAVAGSIVTTVGVVLLYQNSTGPFESWAYAWALVGPAAAGLGMLLYGLVFAQRDLVPIGTRLLAVGAAVFVAGYWFFESIFATGRAPIELGAWWPVAMVAVGVAVVLVGLLGRGRPFGNREAQTSAQGDAR